MTSFSQAARLMSATGAGAAARIRSRDAQSAEANSCGFTLIELLVVIAIIGCLLLSCYLPFRVQKNLLAGLEQ
jgi:prepilin-type N-terminal cleavage/methylation domain-containing protein